MTALSAADFERAITWNPMIAAELIGKDTQYRDEGKERCWGSFHVCRQTGLWYDFAASAGGLSSLELIRFLKKRAGEAWSSKDADRWLIKFLEKHLGTGQLESEDEEGTQARREATAALARHHLDIAEPLPEDGSEVAYLTSRGLPGPYPETLRRIAQARPGESALIMPLTVFGRITGVLETYIDALGRKSLVLPNRRRLNLERAPGAAMLIHEPTPGVISIEATRIITEGLENALSIAHPEVTHPGWAISGLVGINTLKNVPAKAGDRIIVAQDSDPEDHPAGIGLQAGIDSLILQGAEVCRTEWTEIGDANAILQAEGPAGLKRRLSKPAGASRKFEGEKLSAEADVNATIAKLAARPRGEWEKARQKLHERTKWRLSTLDHEYEQARKKVVSSSEADDAGLLSVPEDPAWAGPIPVLLPILEAIRTHFRRFASITEEQLTAVILWIAAAHLMHSTKLDIDLFPKLAIESKDPASGKTTLLTLVWNCLPRAKLWTYPTGAYLVRALEQARFSLCLDELQYAEDKNLLRVINASQHRAMAYVPLLVPDHKGAYIPHEYFVWAPMALARLGEFSTAQQSRSIVIWMLPKLPGDKKQHLRRPLVPELADCRRQLAAWANSLTSWTDPKLPTLLHNRDSDNWISLLFVAEQAGGRWVQHAHKAVEELMKTERQPTINVRLLRSIWSIYQPDPGKEAMRFLPTSELLARLIKDADEDWNTMGPAGRSITPEWLRERLRNLLDPPGSTRESASGARGYAFRQFKMVFERYLGTHPALDTAIIDTGEGSSDRPGPPGSAGDKSEKPSKIKSDFKPGATSGPARRPAQSDSADAMPGEKPGESLPEKHPAHEKLKDSAKIPDEVRSEPGDPGQSGRAPLDTDPPDEWGWLDEAERAAAEGTSTTESPKTAETLGPTPPEKARPTARSRRTTARPKRAKANGGDPDPVAESTAAPMLDLSEPSLLDYIAGAIAVEIRQLRTAYPNRSIKWLAQQSGQPPSVVREILGNGEGSE